MGKGDVCNTRRVMRPSPTAAVSGASIVDRVRARRVVAGTGESHHPHLAGASIAQHQGTFLRGGTGGDDIIQQRHSQAGEAWT